MPEAISPEERLERIGRLLVKAMYLRGCGDGVATDKETGCDAEAPEKGVEEQDKVMEEEAERIASYAGYGQTG